MSKPDSDRSITSSADSIRLMVRSTTEKDVAGIVRVMRMPEVQPFQYRVPRKVEQRLTVELQKELPVGMYRVHQVIQHNEKIIGHVDHLVVDGAEKKVAFGGWNLHPEYWGQGIMTQVLGRQFDYLINDRNLDLIIANCFDNNERCIRLLKSLGFAQVRLSFFHHLAMRISSMCWKVHFQFQLPAESWKKQEGKWQKKQQLASEQIMLEMRHE